ncbi:MAG: hypothetical protein LBB88_05185 [Planctomycetaceae bacterium]|nr:hypothetical protein [Planctomycetaceae bacterium]
MGGLGGHWGRWGQWGRSCLKSVINDSCYTLATLDLVGDLSAKGRLPESAVAYMIWGSKCVT